MTYRIADIQGIDPANAEKLANAGIFSSGDLLAIGCTATGRQKVAEMTGLRKSQILKWANMADLMRISGLGPQYVELLKGAGVDTIMELRTHNAANLVAKLAVVNQSKHLSGASPMEEAVQEWIDSANHMTPLISYLTIKSF